MLLKQFVVKNQLFPPNPLQATALVKSYCIHYLWLPQQITSEWLRATEMYSHRDVSRAVLSGALEENQFFALSQFWSLQGFLGLGLCPSNLCLCLHRVFSSVYSLVRTLDIGFIQDNLILLFFITSAKTLFQIRSHSQVLRE